MVRWRRYARANGFDSTIDGTFFLAVNPMENRTYGHLFTFNADNKTAMEITSSNLKMTPTAISISPSKRNTKVFLKNSETEKSTIEVLNFDEPNRKLQHIRTINHPIIDSVYDVAAVSSTTFFASVTTLRGRMVVIERMVQVSMGSIVFHDGKSFKTVVPSISAPTGLVFDSFRKVLLVGLFARNSIAVYFVRGKSVEYSHEVEVGCSPTSLWKDIDGSLIITCQPVRWRYLLPLLTAAPSSPSQVLSVKIPLDPNKSA
ncbi:unnamed protein product [Caenorhabditis auriculariae]|uniref:Uncharacterized protein n=1 Tax=Caenorhabditis auriculariae TaxID=2777116 RepID=A0A8S1GPZ2_9PELO|nr:unnamed protein product [Caenorhabditis auriculariae]